MPEKSSMTLSITIQKTGSHNFEKYTVRGHASSHESQFQLLHIRKSSVQTCPEHWDVTRLFWNSGDSAVFAGLRAGEWWNILPRTLRWKIALCLIGRPNHGWSSHEKASIKWWPTVRAIAETEASWDGVLAVLAEQAMMMLLIFILIKSIVLHIIVYNSYNSARARSP